MRRVEGRPTTGSRAVAVLLLATSFLVAVADPAEAKRRGHARKAVSGYNPPYAAMVVDVKSGRTLHAVNEDALRHPASITKVMTLYMLFEQLEKGRYDLDSPLSISANAAAQAPSKLGLRPGSTVTVEEAIKALVTKSANDVACAIGENIAGSEPRFAEMMTRKAKALGMSRTHYANASGLPDPDQITTAHDLTLLARAIQDRFPRYYRYFQTRSFAFRGRTIGNHNRLLGNVEGVDGIKTGYTRDSGFNLMTAAKLGDRQIVAIVLGGKSGASRDRIMADLVRANLPRAFAGSRQTAPVVEVAERGRPAVVAEADSRTRTVLASADDEDIETTSSTSNAPLDIRPATTTPGSRRTTLQALPGAAQAYAGSAGQAPFPRHGRQVDRPPARRRGRRLPGRGPAEGCPRRQRQARHAEPLGDPARRHGRRGQGEVDPRRRPQPHRHAVQGRALHGARDPWRHHAVPRPLLGICRTEHRAGCLRRAEEERLQLLRDPELIASNSHPRCGCRRVRPATAR